MIFGGQNCMFDGKTNTKIDVLFLVDWTSKVFQKSYNTLKISKQRTLVKSTADTLFPQNR